MSVLVRPESGQYNPVAIRCPRERRQLKHRAEGNSRIVPVHPELTRLLREHLDKFSTASDGRLFGGVRGGELPAITYRRAWIKARQTALSAAEEASRGQRAHSAVSESGAAGTRTQDRRIMSPLL